MSNTCVYIGNSSKTQLIDSLQHLQNKQPSSSKSTIALFGSYDPDILFAKPGAKVPKAKAIADPYYGGNSGFDDCYEQCVRYAEGFLDMLEKEV